MPRPRSNRSAAGKSVEALRHEQETRTNIPTAEYQSMVEEDTESPLRVSYQRRNRDLDPQLVWRGKDEQDVGDLVVNVPPLYIQEKVHPKVLIDDLLRQSRNGSQPSEYQVDMFTDFNGLPEGADRTEFYQHEGYWQNRMILGDSLQVMASLSEREGLQGKVQCIYIDPPYGIRFNSNFQWSTTSRDVRDGNRQHITREPEQVKAFRDTWRDGIHSYLTYLRDRLTVARDLLADSGSVFVQIGDENVHRVRALMDEVFGEDNFIAQIAFTKTGGFSSDFFTGVFDFLLQYGKDRSKTKFRRLYTDKSTARSGLGNYGIAEDSNANTRSITAAEKANPSLIPEGLKLFGLHSLTSGGGATLNQPYIYQGIRYNLKPRDNWKASYPVGMDRLNRAGRMGGTSKRIGYKRYFDDFPFVELTNMWSDTRGEMDMRYVVQTTERIIERCILSSTDPGDVVLDPTCGSGTTAYVAEQWGRRWITIDTSRVALALARARIMGARYPYYILADSKDGQLKEAEISRRASSDMPTYGNLRQGFVYERVPHITLRDIANNAEIDVIYEEYLEKLEPLRGGAEPHTGDRVGGVGDSPRRRRIVDGGGAGTAPAVVGAAHRPSEGDRRLHRRPGRVRVPVRQALRGPQQGAGGRPLHRGEHFAPPGAGRGRERRCDRWHRRGPQRLRHGLRLRSDHPGQPEALRRAAGPPGGPHHFHLPDALAGEVRLRRWPVRRGWRR